MLVKKCENSVFTSIIQKSSNIKLVGMILQYDENLHGVYDIFLWCLQIRLYTMGYDLYTVHSKTLSHKKKKSRVNLVLTSPILKPSTERRTEPSSRRYDRYSLYPIRQLAEESWVTLRKSNRRKKNSSRRHSVHITFQRSEELPSPPALREGLLCLENTIHTVTEE